MILGLFTCCSICSEHRPLLPILQILAKMELPPETALGPLFQLSSAVEQTSSKVRGFKPPPFICLWVCDGVGLGGDSSALLHVAFAGLAGWGRRIPGGFTYMSGTSAEMAGWDSLSPHEDFTSGTSLRGGWLLRRWKRKPQGTLRTMLRSHMVSLLSHSADQSKSQGQHRSRGGKVDSISSSDKCLEDWKEKPVAVFAANFHTLPD